MAKNGFKVLDSDMHILEPGDLWLRYMEPEYRDQAPRATNEYFMDLRLKHDGRIISRSQEHFADAADMYVELTDRYGRMEEFKAYESRGWGPDTQLEAMDVEGIDIALLFPSMGLFAHAKEYDDDNLAAAISRAYNNWLAEFCQSDNNRMYGSAMVTAQNIEAAVEESRRAGEKLGFKSIFLRPNPMRGRNWHHPYYDPLWAECQRLDLAVGFHEGTPCELPVAMGERFDGQHEDLWTTEHLAAHPIEQMYACLSVIMGGVTERFPDLRIAFLEGNCSWLPFWLWRMDEHYEHREKVLKERLPLLPTEYFKRQCYASVEADESPGKYAVDWLGDDNIVFSTDYPHPDTRYPRSVEVFLTLPFPEESLRKILWDNCARLYGLA
ncbi:MAG: amidohydrolase family protein [Chloroflexi bacterium]|nr:amidohydrolase family protein [Chloroflexota bacterium]